MERFFGRALLLLLPVSGLTGCASPGVLAAAEIAAVPVFQRSIPDVVVSAVSGKDCSVVRLDQGKTYCRPIEPLPERQPFCTRSLGQVDCWLNPAALEPPASEVADGPAALTPAQEANRTRRWPGL